MNWAPRMLKDIVDEELVKGVSITSARCLIDHGRDNNVKMWVFCVRLINSTATAIQRQVLQ